MNKQPITISAHSATTGDILGDRWHRLNGVLRVPMMLLRLVPFAEKKFALFTHPPLFYRHGRNPAGAAV